MARSERSDGRGEQAELWPASARPSEASGRATLTDVDCEAIFEPSEWKAVWVAVHNKKPPKTPPRLSVMVHWIASLGGYVERPKSEPGAQTVWIGLQRMHDLTWAWDSFGPGASSSRS